MGRPSTDAPARGRGRAESPRARLRSAESPLGTEARAGRDWAAVCLSLPGAPPGGSQVSVFQGRVEPTAHPVCGAEPHSPQCVTHWAPSFLMKSSHTGDGRLFGLGAPLARPLCTSALHGVRRQVLPRAVRTLDSSWADTGHAWPVGTAVPIPA